MPNDAASYRAACTIVRLTTKGPLEILLTVQVPGDSAAGNDGQFN